MEYYEKLLKDIREDIDSQKYQEANQLIMQELAMPYVPKDTLEKLENLLDEVNQYLVKEKKMILLTPQEVREYLFSPSDYVDVVLDTLSKSNIRNYMEVLLEYLVYPKANRYTVAIIIDLMRQQQIGDTIQYLDHGSIKLCTPNKLSNPLDSQVVYDTWDKLGELFSKDPSFLENARTVLAQVAYNRYPTEIKDDLNLLTYQIAKYVFKAFQDEQGWLEFAKNNGIDEKKVLDLKGI